MNFKFLDYFKLVKTVCTAVVLLLLQTIIYAQVGINTTTPHATLDIRSTNVASPEPTDGILIPKIDHFPATVPSANQDGMLVFVTGNGTPNRGVYYWDHANTSWVLVSGSATGSGNTLDQAYDQGGAGLGKNINATNGAVRINGDDGLLVTGIYGSGNTIDTEVTGIGTRMFFNPNKGAFRAGTIFDFFPFPVDQWDDVNIGFNSMSLGINTLASGNTSTAFGGFTTASGSSSTAFGSGSIASGDRSTALGSQTVASGGISTAFGNQSNASGVGATAFGSFTSASQTYATAFGYLSIASGNQSTAFGFDTTATSERATAYGSRTIASGNVSTAFGLQTEASGDIATAFGFGSQASGGSATAFGISTQASGAATTAYGIGTTALSSYETTLGMYNTSYTPIVTGTGYSVQDRIFTVGNGTSDTQRHNALTIYKSGLVNINDAYNLPTTDGTANQVLMTNGSGDVSFQSISNTVYSLNQSYNAGGTGNGRIINAFSGPVEIQNNGGLIVSSFNQPNMLFVDGANDQVGISTNAATAELSVNGTANKPGGGTWAVFSDKRLKEQINDYDEGLNLITKVRPVSFKYNSKLKSLLGESKTIDNNIFQGVIAQELQQIAPDMVREVKVNSETYLEVDPNKFTYALINAVQEQQQIIENQNTQLQQLKAELTKQQREIEAIKKRLDKL